MRCKMCRKQILGKIAYRNQTPVCSACFERSRYNGLESSFWKQFRLNDKIEKGGL